MRHVLTVLLCLSVVPTPAWAGERYLGKIVSSAGADTTNETTATPFWVPKGAKLTIVCNASAYICVDTTSSCSSTGWVDGGSSQSGLPVTAGEKFPTSVGQVGISTNPSGSGVGGGGGTLAAGSAIVRIFGSAAVTCDVFSRDGLE